MMLGDSLPTMRARSRTVSAPVSQGAGARNPFFGTRGSFGSRIVVGLVDRKVVSNGLMRVAFHFPSRVNVHQRRSQALDRVEERMFCLSRYIVPLMNIQRS